MSKQRTIMLILQNFRYFELCTNRFEINLPRLVFIIFFLKPWLAFVTYHRGQQRAICQRSVTVSARIQPSSSRMVKKDATHNMSCPSLNKKPEMRGKYSVIIRQLFIAKYFCREPCRPAFVFNVLFWYHVSKRWHNKTDMIGLKSMMMSSFISYFTWSWRKDFRFKVFPVYFSCRWLIRVNSRDFEKRARHHLASKGVSIKKSKWAFWSMIVIGSWKTGSKGE